MLYEAPVDNLKCLMRSCTVLSRSGLYRFFSSQLTQAQVDFLINALANQRVLDIDEQDYELIWFHRMGLKTSRLRPEYVKAKIRAFWVIARVGCDAILDVTSLDHPMQFSFIASTFATPLTSQRLLFTSEANANGAPLRRRLRTSHW